MYMGRTLAALFLASYGAAAWFTWKGDQALVRAATFEQAAGEGDGLPPGTRFARKKVAGGVQVETAFRNFNDDLVPLRFVVPRAEIDASWSEFGYNQKGLDQVFKDFAKQGDAVYRKKLAEYLKDRGFRMAREGVVVVDFPLMVKRNSPRLQPVALAIEEFASARNYGSGETIGAATSMVQTAVAYKVPPPELEGRHTGGVLPPPRALTEGWGDCDTKSALLASILTNWEGMRGVGIALPGHYIMGIQRTAAKGDAFIEHEGVHFVLIEPAGPAWLPPGQLSQETLDQLDSMDGVPIQPFS